MRRRRKANKLAKSHGYTSSSKNQKLLGWSLFITNIPETKIKAKNIELLYKLRWQIELLFKLYKSHFRLDKFQTSNPCRVLCELYARLCAILIFHALSTCLMIKENTEISLTKTYLDFKSRAGGLFLVLQEKTANLRHFIMTFLNSWQRFSLKDRYRKTRLSTLNSLKLIHEIS